MKNGQFSVEFLAQVGILMTVYIIVLGAFYIYLDKNILDQEYGENACYQISNAIDSAVIGGNGFTSVLTIPNNINQKTLRSILITNKSYISLDWNSGLYACSIITQNITFDEIYPGGTGSIFNNNNRINYASIKTDSIKYIYQIYDIPIVNVTGKYFYNNINATITTLSINEIISGYPKTIVPLSNGIANDSWQVPGVGQYKIQWRDTVNKNYIAETIIEVI